MSLLMAFVKIFFLNSNGDYPPDDSPIHCPLKMGARFSKKAFTPSR